MKLWKYVFILLLLIFALVVIAVAESPDSKFHLIACDVGEGDATLMIYRNLQVLVDGGPDAKVLDCLGRHLPFWDRELELVILTHPDSDHFRGLTEVLRRYKIDNYLYNPISISKPEYGVLEKEVGSAHPRTYYPRPGLVIRLDLIYIDILSPNISEIGGGVDGNSLLEVTDAKTNDYSIVSLVSFKNFKALLTGDMPPAVSDGLAEKWANGPVNYIKIPHHGSKNGLTENLLKVLVPETGVISVGAKNLWGFPSPEILEMLKKYNVKVLRTDEIGDVEITIN